MIILEKLILRTWTCRQLLSTLLTQTWFGDGGGEGVRDRGAHRIAKISDVAVREGGKFSSWRESEPWKKKRRKEKEREERKKGGDKTSERAAEPRSSLGSLEPTT